jgi:integrase
VALDALRAQRQRVVEQRLRAGAAWQDHDLVFPALGPTGDGRPLRLAVVSRALGEACARAGVSRLSMHGFRHLHGSLLLDLGLPLPAVSRRLGHAHPGITAAVYSHAVRADGAAALLDRALPWQGQGQEGHGQGHGPWVPPADDHAADDALP